MPGAPWLSLRLVAPLCSSPWAASSGAPLLKDWGRSTLVLGSPLVVPVRWSECVASALWDEEDTRWERASTWGAQTNAGGGLGPPVPQYVCVTAI